MFSIFLVSQKIHAAQGTHHDLCQRDSPRCFDTALSRAADVMMKNPAIGSMGLVNVLTFMNGWFLL